MSSDELQGDLPLGLAATGIDAILAETAESIDNLYRAAAEQGKAAPWTKILDRISKSTHMAPFNMMLADVQRPGARYVAFRKDWVRLGRQIKPGAIPIVVLWPFCPVRFAFDLSDTTGPETEDAVLDQMFGEPLPVPSDAAGKLARRALKEDQIEVKVSALGSNLAGDARATGAETAKRGTEQKPKWVVRIASHLNDGAKFTTLIHELAHIYLGHLGSNGHKWPDRRPERLDAQEFEAEAVSFLVGSRFGLNTHSADYLREYIEGDTIEHVSVSAIARAAGRIEQHAR